MRATIEAYVYLFTEADITNATVAELVEGIFFIDDIVGATNHPRSIEPSIKKDACRIILKNGRDFIVDLDYRFVAQLVKSQNRFCSN